MNSNLQSCAAATGVALDGDGALACLCPTDPEQVRAILTYAEREGLPVLPMGGGTKLAWCRPEWCEDPPGLALSTRRMNRVVEYVAGDGTITAQAGASIESLAETVAAGGHRLTPDVPLAAAATLGGVLGAGLSGIDRLRLGPLRHHVLGVTAMLADGTVARSGGRLVKNVTGFDLHRLYAGARGTLCLILEASLRLFPEPEEETAYSLAHPDWASALACAEDLRGAHLPASALVLESRAEDVLLHLCLAGRGQQLAEAQERVQSLLPRAERHTGEAAADRRGRLRDSAAPSGTWPQLRLMAPGPAFPGAVEATSDRLAQRGHPARLVAHPAVGTCDLFVPDLLASDRAEESIRSIRRDAAEAGGRLDLGELPAALHASLAPQPDRPEQRWSLALAQRFDPQGRFASPTFPCRRP